MTAVWWCRCPQVVRDRHGHEHRCGEDARVADLLDQDSTSGPVLLAVVVCDVRHRTHVVWDELDLRA